METMITGAIAFAREETAEEAHTRFDLAELLNEIAAQFAETGRRDPLRAAPAQMVVTIRGSWPRYPGRRAGTGLRALLSSRGLAKPRRWGHGLGLSGCAHVVRGHGGEIKLGNRPQGGLLQTVALPRSI